MMIEKVFRIELDDSGAILSCLEVAIGETKRGTKHVRFVHAIDAAAACDKAKRWYASAMERSAKWSKDRRSVRVARGECADQFIGCTGSPVLGKKACKACLLVAAARKDEYRKGIRVAKEKLPLDVRARKFKEKLRDRSRAFKLANGGIFYRAQCLKKLDSLGPVAFRAWLVAEIERYQREHADPEPVAEAAQ